LFADVTHEYKVECVQVQLSAAFWLAWDIAMLVEASGTCGHAEQAFGQVEFRKLFCPHMQNWLYETHQP
jgi:hypothetical protein